MFRVFFDMDGTLAEWKAAKEPEDLYEKDYFLSLKPYQSVVEAAWKLYESGEAEKYSFCLRFSMTAAMPFRRRMRGSTSI